MKLIHLDAHVVLKNQREIIARQVSDSVGALTETELKQASVDAFAKAIVTHLERWTGKGIAGIAMVEDDEHPHTSRLAVTLTNGYVLLLPSSRKGVA